MTSLRLRGVERTFAGPPPATALRSVDLDLGQGEFLAIEGPSGGGKSTLLNVIGLLDRPTGGTYSIDGVAVDVATQKQAAEMRSSLFAFVFQGFHLMDHRPVIHSVELGLLYRAVPARERRMRARGALRAVGLDGAADQRAATLSGGQKQRVAIARAMAAGTPVILADEPTGNLDSENSALVVESLRAANATGSTIVLITHSSEVAEAAARRARIRDGVLFEGEEPQPSRSVSAPIPPGRPSRVRSIDVLKDAAWSLRARRGRTAGLALMVTLAVALAVGSLGIATSARSQVAETFDAHANREVSAEWTSTPGESLATSGILERFGQQAGVDSVVVLEDYGQREVRATWARDAIYVSVLGSFGDVESAGRLTIDWVSGVSPKNGVLIGQSLAEQLDIVLLAEGPSIVLGDSTAPIAGVITSSPRLPELLGGVIAGESIRGREWTAGRSQALAVTASGAAQQVAALAPLLVDPTDPARVSVFAPVDPTTLRIEVEQDVLDILLAFTAVSLVAASAAVANSMVVSVLERRREIGLRKALGARGIHVVALVLAESSMIGAAGGLLGLLTGLAAILAVTIVRGWIPVFDPLYAPAAILGGIVVGMIGGGVAASRASRLAPSEALQA